MHGVINYCMVIRKILSIFLVILMASAFMVAPVTAKVSKSASKMCCKGHCLMAMPAKGSMAGHHGDHGKEMISCCKDHCLAGTEEKVLSVRAIDSKHSGVFKESPAHIFASASYYFFSTMQSPGNLSLAATQPPLAPFFILHSSLLI